MDNIYLVTLIDRETGKMQKIAVLSPCPDGMQEFVEGPLDPPLTLAHPRVVEIEEVGAPLPDPA